MVSQELPKKQRISKSHGFIMIVVGILFDLLPFILILAAIGVVMYGLGGDAETVAGAAQGSKLDMFKLGVSGAGGIATAILAGPLLYVIGSFITLVFGYFSFTIWFLFKGVNIWSFNSVQRVLVNAIAVAVESIPILNMLPGITLMVWRHVKVTQAEDFLTNSLEGEKVQKQLAHFAKSK